VGARAAAVEVAVAEVLAVLDVLVLVVLDVVRVVLGDRVLVLEVVGGTHREVVVVLRVVVVGLGC